MNDEIDAGARVRCMLTQQLGTVLVRYVSQMSGLPLLAVLWDGSGKPELTLPETVKIADNLIFNSGVYLRCAKENMS